MKHLRKFNENSSNREEMIEMISRTSNFEKDELEKKSDSELKELYDTLEVEEWEEELSIADKVMLQKSFKDFSKLLGIDPIWFADYLHECFSFNLDQSEMPFSDEKFEEILIKLERLRKDI